MVKFGVNGAYPVDPPPKQVVGCVIEDSVGDGWNATRGGRVRDAHLGDADVKSGMQSRRRPAVTGRTGRTGWTGWPSRSRRSRWPRGSGGTARATGREKQHG